jgi:secondary thiamine-phosphate synthase enzyme
MLSTTLPGAPPRALRQRSAQCQTWHQVIPVETHESLEFIDITDRVGDVVRASGIASGIVNVQTRHTTTAIMVNEHEPLLLDDMKRLLDRLAPRHAPYRHDDFSIRTVNLCPNEEQNGHAHCKALFLRVSETLNVVDGALDLGCWQRIFLIELDRGRQRAVSVMLLGEPA